MSLVVPLVISLEPQNETDCMTAQASCVLEVANIDANGIDESLSACLRF
jgi:hypothetical protein